jgi:hypothetical protein
MVAALPFVSLIICLTLVSFLAMLMPLLFHVVYGIIDEGVVIRGRGCLITLASDLSDMLLANSA